MHACPLLPLCFFLSDSKKKNKKKEQKEKEGDRERVAYAMASLGQPGAVPVPRCSVVFNGTNWSEFAFHMEIYMGGQQLWLYLTGERPCPPTPVLPTPPTYAPDAPDAIKLPLLEAFETQMETYQSALDMQATWLHEEACAKAILLASMEIEISLSLRGLSTSRCGLTFVAVMRFIMRPCTSQWLRKPSHFVSTTLPWRSFIVRCLPYDIVWTPWVLSSVLVAPASAVIVTGDNGRLYVFTSSSPVSVLSLRLSGPSS
jgi:hypothetical protein